MFVSVSFSGCSYCSVGILSLQSDLPVSRIARLAVQTRWGLSWSSRTFSLLSSGWRFVQEDRRYFCYAHQRSGESRTVFSFYKSGVGCVVTCCYADFFLIVRRNLVISTWLHLFLQVILFQSSMFSCQFLYHKCLTVNVLYLVILITEFPFTVYLLSVY